MSDSALQNTIAPNSLERSLLADRFIEIRNTTEEICGPLYIEDYVIQSMPDVSPPKWHLGHTTWFFEELILVPYWPHYKRYNQAFNFLFNSYYEALGERVPRPERGNLSRPTVHETYTYRSLVDNAMIEFIESCEEETLRQVTPVIILGLHHEKQHQELLLMDIKHIFWTNPLRPSYRRPKEHESTTQASKEFVDFTGGLFELGHRGDEFSYDNERPAHKVYLEDFKICSKLLTNGEFLEFIEDGGYRRPQYWCSDGWKAVREHGWQAPLYWEKNGNEWWSMRLSGMAPLDLEGPVCHISFYEADAFARWRGKRLPSEYEWELVARQTEKDGHFLEDEHFHPLPARKNSKNLEQFFGDVWEWTSSSYSPYPGYLPFAGALGEYNGKFMCNQKVLRGGAVVTPRSHIRETYRNYYYPDSRWQFSGMRLAS